MSRDRARMLALRGCIVVATAIAVLTTTAVGWSRAQDTSFEATAIIGPVTLRVNPIRVGRIVTALNRGPHPEDAGGIEFSIRPARGSRLTLVTAQGDDPSEVAAAANERAVALVDRLNVAAQGVAVFKVSAPAVEPRARERPPGPKSFVTMGIVAFVSLTAAVIGSIGRARTPRESRDAR